MTNRKDYQELNVTNSRYTFIKFHISELGSVYASFRDNLLGTVINVPTGISPAFLTGEM